MRKNFKERMADAPNNFPLRVKDINVTVYKKKKDYKYENTELVLAKELFMNSLFALMNARPNQ